MFLTGRNWLASIWLVMAVSLRHLRVVRWLVVFSASFAQEKLHLCRTVRLASHVNDSTVESLQARSGFSLENSTVKKCN